MLLSRDEVVSALFCETDRTLRMKVPLALIHFGLADGAMGHADGENRQGALEKVTNAKTAQSIVDLCARFLRCYDTVGRIAEGEFVLILPGCGLSGARKLAERLRDAMSESQFAEGGYRMTACFGVVSSGGRSPLVVLREAEKALQQARAAGPGSIKGFVKEEELNAATFLFPVPLDESLHG